MTVLRPFRVIAGLFLFGVAFGFVEAAVVIDLRAVYEPLHVKLYSDRVQDDLFPLLTISNLRSAGEVPLRLLRVELAREAATLVMIAAIALLVARNAYEWLAGFLIVFGVWDLAFYAFLRLLIGWPASLGTWDLLFLLPVPWTAPVVAPMAVALGMILAGLGILIRETLDKPIRFGLDQIAGMGSGTLIILASFCWNYQAILVGSRPTPFAWWIFLVGYFCTATGFATAFVRSPPLGDLKSSR